MINSSCSVSGEFTDMLFYGYVTVSRFYGKHSKQTGRMPWILLSCLLTECLRSYMNRYIKLCLREYRTDEVNVKE